MCLHAPTPAVANTVSLKVPLGRTGRGLGTCCTDTPEDDALISVEEDEDDDEES